MKDIHDFQRRMDYMNGVKGEQAEKPKVREKLETDIAEFLASGGKITEVPAPEYVRRQPCKNPKPYPKRPNPKPFRNHKYNTLLREWLTKGEARARRLAEISDYNEVWLCQRRIGYFQLLLADYEILRKCMDRVEHDEKLKTMVEKHLKENREQEAQQEA